MLAKSNNTIDIPNKYKIYSPLNVKFNNPIFSDRNENYINEGTNTNNNDGEKHQNNISGITKNIAPKNMNTDFLELKILINKLGLENSKINSKIKILEDVFNTLLDEINDIYSLIYNVIQPKTKKELYKSASDFFNSSNKGKINLFKNLKIKNNNKNFFNEMKNNFNNNKIYVHNDVILGDENKSNSVKKHLSDLKSYLKKIEPFLFKEFNKDSV